MVADVNWQHGGTSISHGETSAEIVERAGLDYRVEPVPLITADSSRLPIRNRVANVRVDPSGERQVVGFVSSNYEIVPNTEALRSFDDVVRRVGARYTQAGTIGDGRIAYAFADLPEPVEILPGDPIVRSLMFTNSFDGSVPLGFILTTQRLWCSNQLVHARRHGRGFSIRHSANARDRARQAGTLLSRAVRSFDRITEQMRMMARTPLDTTGLRTYFDAVEPLPEKEARRRAVQARHERWTQRYECGIGNDGRRTRSLFHAVNAITEDVDHRDLGRRVKDPMFYATLGAGGRLKQRAFTIAERLMGNNN